MSEFTGSCGHLVRSNGWCDECQRKVNVQLVDGLNGREIEYREEREDYLSRRGDDEYHNRKAHK